MKVLVTGHDGYIGSVMTWDLVEAGHIVGGIDNNYFPYNPLGLIRNKIPSLLKDIRDISISDVKGFDAIIHLAALSNDPMAELNPDLTYDINLFGTLRLAQVAKMAGVKRFIFSSSCSVYGSGSMSEDGKLSPISAYAVSKAKSEEGLLKLADSDFCPVIMRNGTVYGSSPSHRTDLVLNAMVLDASVKGEINIFGDGNLYRPIVHIWDVSKAFLCALNAPREKVFCQIFNVGCNYENYRVKEIAEIVQKVIPSCPIKYHENKGDARSYQVSFDKIHNILGWNSERTALGGAQNLFVDYRLSGLRYRVERLSQMKKLIEIGAVDSQLRWRNNG